MHPRTAMKITLLGLLALVFLSTPGVATAQFTYTTNDGAITITGYTGPGGAVVIPATINNWPVIAIGDNAFASKTGLTSVTIPGSVNSIGYAAFEFCTSLTNVTIPVSVANIGWHAFASCTALANVTIPGSVITIGSYAFQYCNGLTSVTIANGVMLINDYAFESC